MDTIQVWQFRTVAQPADITKLARFLSENEIVRADRYATRELRETYIVTRGMLRVLLARTQGIAPHEVAFEYGLHGKPELAGATTVQFNLSHSGEWSLLAVADGCAVGADLERVRPLADFVPIAQSHFSRGEVEDLLALPEQERLRGFYRCWTRKEAFLKATGEGLSVPLERFRVTLAPGAAARLLQIDGSEMEAAAWNLHAVEAPPGYEAALAYRGPRRRIERCALMEGPGRLST